MTSVRVPSRASAMSSALSGGLSAAVAMFQSRAETAPTEVVGEQAWHRLRAVPDGYVPLRIRARRRRRLLIGLVVLAAVMVLGVAAAHAALIQGQMQLQDLEEQVAEQQGAYQRLRLEVARLESPERIVSAAQQRLGMVPPPGVTYLSPRGPVAADPEVTGDGSEPASSTAPGAGWAAVKPYTIPVGR